MSGTANLSTARRVARSAAPGSIGTSRLDEARPRDVTMQRELGLSIWNSPRALMLIPLIPLIGLMFRYQI
jgi:hypothetical protein